MKKMNKATHVIRHDNLNDFSCIATLLAKDQVCISSKVYPDTDFGNLETLIQEMIENILETGPAQCDLNWNLIKLIADFLKIQHYNTNLFSSWILRSLLQQVIYHADALNKCDYTLFISWIFEEINLIRYSAGMTKENFFRLISDIFQMAMSKILEGEGLLHPLELISQFWEEESESISKIYMAKCGSEITVSLKNDEGSTSSAGIQADSQFETTTKYFEKVLHTIMTATYELFSREVDYALIQMAGVDEEHALNYTVPYHFRKPRIVKKDDTNRKLSHTPNSKQGTIIKKRKLIRKSSSDNYTLASNDSGNNFKQHYYILPLSDAIVCQDFTQVAEGEREGKNDYDI